MSAWWPLEDGCVNDDDGGCYGGQGNRGPAKTATPTPPQKSLGTSKSLPWQIESGLQSDPQSGRRDRAPEHLGCDLSDVEPPPSLLTQPHIRTLLFIDGIYSVRLLFSFEDWVSRVCQA